ncbi:hypothetical protein CORC01_12721 [Colletotrichum orchidophilum]|uniref:Uncharacterized protein n=1 Tax=Colletotrichum orchidophilum TaxID=1209926 RepID=A0A1G4AS86_9PEZI|nr:uncharacterized protein CORC01_12721 [Colletotrichum orchidophilum]OHE91985.1 hypothetical protein CORC01_12721 [Colletotrichum orchidophilum]
MVPAFLQLGSANGDHPLRIMKAASTADPSDVRGIMGSAPAKQATRRQRGTPSVVASAQGMTSLQDGGVRISRAASRVTPRRGAAWLLHGLPTEAPPQDSGGLHLENLSFISDEKAPANSKNSQVVAHSSDEYGYGSQTIQQASLEHEESLAPGRSTGSFQRPKSCSARFISSVAGMDYFREEHSKVFGRIPWSLSSEHSVELDLALLCHGFEQFGVHEICSEKASRQTTRSAIGRQ